MNNKEEIKNLEKIELKGQNLIEASAGTGKTYTIAGLVLRLIIEKEIPIEDILVVTFTNAATEELKQKIHNVLVSARSYLKDNSTVTEEYIPTVLNDVNKKKAKELLTGALRDFDDASIFTIHGFCQRVLIENAFYSSSMYDFEILPDQRELVEQAIQDFWRKEIYDAPSHIVENFISKNINELVKLFYLKINNPDLRFEKGFEGDVEDIEPLQNNFYEALKEFQNYFPENKDDFENFVDWKKVNGKKYGKKNVLKAYDTIKEFIFSDIKEIEKKLKNEKISKKFAYFTLSKLNEVTKIPGDTAYLNRELFEFGDELLNSFDKYISETEKDIIQYQINMIDFSEKKLEEEKLKENVKSFNDFLIQLRRALTETKLSSDFADRLSLKYKAALIDEFQDTDPVQWEIFQRVFKENHLVFLIGDPKQAIYGFRGADVYTYISVSENFKGKKYYLSFNYRSDKKLVEAVNYLFKKENPFFEEQITYSPIKSAVVPSRCLKVEGKEETPVTIWVKDSDKEYLTKDIAYKSINSAIIGEIKRLLRLSNENKAGIEENGSFKPLQPSDFTVLVRENDEMFELKNEMDKNGIPCVTFGAKSIFESDEAVIIKDFLDCLISPGSTINIRKILISPLFGYTFEKIYELNNLENGYENFQEIFRTCAELYDIEKFMGVYLKFCRDFDIQENLIKLKGGERKLANLNHLAEILHEESVSNTNNLISLKRWLDNQINNIREQEEYETRMESDENAVNIVTIHKSKGLEYPIVFAPFLWKGVSGNRKTFHNENNELIYQFIINKDSEEKEQIFKEELSEQLRLYYVAITRAKHKFYTFWSNFHYTSNFKTSAPAYLYHDGNIGGFNYKNINELNSALRDKFSENDLIEIKNLPQNDSYELKINNIPGELNCKEYGRTGLNIFRITSFSAMTSKVEFHNDEYEFDEVNLPLEIETDEPDIFNFPRGAGPGTCIHEIFELIEFENFNKEKVLSIVKEILDKYNIDLIYTDIITDMLHNVLNADLGGFKLADVSEKRKLVEMEFYLPMKSFDKNDLIEIFRDVKDEYVKYLDLLLIEASKGFLHGFVDLIFEMDGKYYVLDWKSNFLGANYDNYDLENLKSEILHNHYFLQYHIYSLALHRYLKLRKKDYDYEKDFGGIYYIFVRGVDGRGNGIFYDKIPLDIMKKMENILLEEKAALNE